MATNLVPGLPAWVTPVFDQLGWSLPVIPIIIYLAMVQAVRFRNLKIMYSTYSRYVQDPYSMDYKIAHEILKAVLLREFPFMYAFGTQWALVKSYGIANGTKLLVQTRRLANEQTVGKRGEDTGIILGEVLISGLDSDRGLRALSKMNWIHRQYGSKISNGDLVHTLALFVLEPQRWIEMYEWRAMTELEKVAAFVYWKEIGNRMGMEDIPKTLEELKQWTKDYEEEHMYYADSNRKCVDATVNLFLRNVPKFFHGFAQDVAATFLEPNVRVAIGVETPPTWVSNLVNTMFKLRAFTIRYLSLSRFRDLDPLAHEGPDGRLHRKDWIFEPWYVPETSWTRFLGKIGLSTKLSPGPQYASKGYLPEELGPVEYEKKSKTAVLKESAEMRTYAERGGGAVLGCPFAFVR
jgi:hypothetical protein